VSVGAERVRVAGLALRCERFARLPSRRHALARPGEGGARKKSLGCKPAKMNVVQSAARYHDIAAHVTITGTDASDSRSGCLSPDEKGVCLAGRTRQMQAFRQKGS
jgi:hypothetical protein